MKPLNKNITKLTLTVIFCCIITTLYLIYYPRIQLKVYNKTKFDIDSLNLDGNFYSIPKGKYIIVKAKKISFQAGYPCEVPKGNVKEMKAMNYNNLSCGTGITEVNNGSYEFDIEILIKKNKYLLEA